MASSCMPCAACDCCAMKLGRSVGQLACPMASAMHIRNTTNDDMQARVPPMHTAISPCRPHMVHVECHLALAPMCMQVGMPLERGCSTCHRRLATAAAAVSFTLQAPPSMRSHAQGHGSSSSSQQAVSCGGGSSRRHMGGWGGLHSPHAVMTVGQPLPDSGTCKHYRHSYRWLRFPCCGEQV